MNVQANNQDFNGVQITVRDGALTVTSRQVAEHFGKQHKNVLRAIANLECSEDFNRLNFEPFKINDLTGESTSHYAMTRDGFTFLVMGFTGKEAARWKERYIAAFNAMEQRLRAGPPPAAPDFSDPAVLLGVMDHLRGQVNAAKTQLLEAKPKIDAYDQLMNAEGLYGLQNAARVLGARPNLFIRWLKQKYLFYQGNALIARVEYRERGFFEIKSTIVDDKTRPATFVTPKGLDYLRQKLPNELLIGGGK